MITFHQGHTMILPKPANVFVYKLLNFTHFYRCVLMHLVMYLLVLVWVIEPTQNTKMWFRKLAINYWYADNLFQLSKTIRTKSAKGSILKYFFFVKMILMKASSRVTIRKKYFELYFFSSLYRNFALVAVL